MALLTASKLPALRKKRQSVLLVPVRVFREVTVINNI